MPLQIVRNDITTMAVDAIVNAAKNSLLGGGGVDGAIHRAAGPKLLEECRTLGGCPTGEARITKGYHLPCRYVIHTVGPIWQGGAQGEEALLRSAYRSSLELAVDNHCETVAFPLISSGIYGYPKAEALKVATDTIDAFLETHPDLTVYLVIFDKAAFFISQDLYSDIQCYIDDRYVDAHTDHDRRRRFWENFRKSSAPDELATRCNAPSAPPPAASAPAARASQPLWSLEEALRRQDVGFSEALLQKIDASGMTDAQCYKKANIDRKLFSKIRSDPHYRPSKPTVLAFCIGLELSLRETEDLLKKAGFALSHSSKFDIIIEYFIRKKCYNILEINEALFAFDQSLLGG